MNRIIGFFLVTLLTATSGVLVSCSSTGSKSASKSVPADVKTPSSAKGTYQLPQFEEKTLPNGLRLLLVPDESLPYISYSLLIRAGSAQDPAKSAGLSSFVADLLDKGTAKRSAVQIANDLGQMGADFGASAEDDYSMISASALSTQADGLLSNFFELVSEPAFSAAEVERHRKQVLAQIEKRVDNPGAFAEVTFTDYLFGPHPYARPTSGTLKSVAAISRKDIIRHYVRYYRPNNAIMAVVGNYTPEHIQKLEKAFGSWEKRDVPLVSPADVPKISGVQIRVVDKPDLVQAQVRIGQPGITRKSQDFLELRLANTILGGAFASRLNDRIRKDLGLTYSIYSYYDARVDVGPFAISTFTKNESVGQLVSESLKLINEFHSQGINNEELARAKGYLKGVFPTNIETREKLASNLMLLRMYGIPDSYLTTYLSEIDNLTISSVNAAIKKNIDPKNLKVLVYTNAEQVAPQLQSLGQVEVKKAAELQNQ